MADPEVLKAGGRVVVIFRPLASSPYEYKLTDTVSVGQQTEEWRMVTTHTFYCTWRIILLSLFTWAISGFIILQSKQPKIFLLFVTLLLLFFFENPEISPSKITWSCVRFRAIKTINYAQSVRSSSFLNLGRDDNLSVITAPSKQIDLYRDLFNSSIIDIRSSVCQRLLRISKIRRSKSLYLPQESVTTRHSEGSGTLIRLELHIKNLILPGIPDTSLSIGIIASKSLSNSFIGYGLGTYTNTANNENFPKEKNGTKIIKIRGLP